MALVLDQSTLFGFIKFASYTGQSTNSFGSADIQISLAGALDIPSILDAELNSTVTITTGYNTYYKLQGWNPITQKYEYWHCMGTPLVNPPSGNALENVSIVSTWTDR